MPKLPCCKGGKSHKQGCPEAWRDERRACPFCGTEFSPSHKDHRFCNLTCSGAYHGR